MTRFPIFIGSRKSGCRELRKDGLQADTTTGKASIYEPISKRSILTHPLKADDDLGLAQKKTMPNLAWFILLRIDKLKISQFHNR